MLVRYRTWLAATALALLALPVLLPLFGLLFSWWPTARVDSALWQHLRSFVLPEALRQTGWLLIGTLLFSGLLGGTLGFVQARYRYPGHALVDALLYAPFAFPIYVTAYIWVGGTDYSSELNQLYQHYFGAERTMPNVSGIAGGIWVFGLSLFPYVFGLVRNASAQIGDNLVASAKLAGLNRVQTLRQLIWPLLRPSFALGLSLVAMETIADFGAASFLGLDTLTTTVYKSWYGLQSLTTASQLASLMVIAVLSLIWLEQISRAKLKTHGSQTASSKHLAGKMLVIWYLTILIVVSISFLLPLLQLLRWAWLAFKGSVSTEWAGIVTALKISGLLAIGAAIVIVGVGLLAASFERQLLHRRHHRLASALTVPLGMGYAMPGTILAIALLLQFQHWGHWGEQLSVGLGVLLIAYLARFARLGFAPFSARLQQISPNLSASAKVAGLNSRQRMLKLYLPLLTPTAISALIMVMVEVLKELPATLVLRPLGWDTLAIRVYNYTSEGLWQQAALPALVLVLAGCIPTLLAIFANRKQTH